MDTSRDPLGDAVAAGCKVIVRAIRREDGPRLQAFVRGLSVRSRRLRFFSTLNELSAEQLDRFVHVAPHRGLALVAVSAQEPDVIIAEARCVLDRDGISAEFALVVADRFQRRTLGRQLVKRLMRYASAKGVRRLFGEIMVDNHPMLAFARRLGFEVRANPLDATTLIAQRAPGATS
jgi:acetyltransferase